MAGAAFGERGKRRKRVTLCPTACRDRHFERWKHSGPLAVTSADCQEEDHLSRIRGGAEPEALEGERSNVEAKRDAGDYDDDDDVNCEFCEREDDEDQMLLCDKCDRGYHMQCLNPVVVAVPAGDWFCPLCRRAPQIIEFPRVQTRIIDFFRIQKLPLDAASSKVQKRRRHSGIFTSLKKSRRLMLHTPTKDPERRLQQMASLATALTSVGVEFSDELTYFSGLAPRSSNRSSMEKGGMQEMGKEDKATFRVFKRMCRGGQWPPLLVTHDVYEGFVVEADSAIKDMTIIAEYTGDVDFMYNRINDDGNDIMGLLFTEDPSNELVICPDKRGNLARFISGINNHTPAGRKKQNVRCVRYDLEGQARALLIAIRDISKGERLYYDYNGYRHDYPTEHFV